MATQTGPHTFRALSLLDGIVPNGRCRHCLWPRRNHPIHFWTSVRFIGDNRRFDEAQMVRLELTSETLE